MSRLSSVLTIGLALFAGVGVLAAQDAQPAEPPVPSTPIRTVDTDFTIGPALQARIDVSTGAVVVRGEDVDRIHARLQVFCLGKSVAKCEKRAGNATVVGKVDGNRITIGLEGVPEAWLRRISVRLEIRVPKTFPMQIQLTEGQIRVDGVTGSLKAEVDKGTVDISADDADVGELLVAAGGKATVEARGEQLTAKGTLSGELRWVRPGRIAKIEGRAKIGDVRVVLD